MPQDLQDLKSKLSQYKSQLQALLLGQDPHPHPNPNPNPNPNPPELDLPTL